MKHISLIIMLLLIGTQASSAQDKFKTQIFFGTSHGITLSSVTLAPKVKQNMYKGYNGGIFMRYVSEKYFSFQIELNYSMRGWEESMEDTPQYEYSRRMNYIELPFLTHIYFGDKIKGFINLGPKIGLFLNEKENINFDSKSTSGIPITYQYHKDTENKIDYGICGGAGIELHSSIGEFGLEGRYYLGLADFFKCGAKSDFNAASMQIISINLTYALPLKKKK